MTIQRSKAREGSARPHRGTMPGRAARARSTQQCPFRAQALLAQPRPRWPYGPEVDCRHACRGRQSYRPDRQYPRRQASVPRRSSAPRPPSVSSAPIISTPAAKRQSRAIRQYPRPPALAAPLRQASVHREPTESFLPGPPGPPPTRTPEPAAAPIGLGSRGGGEGVGASRPVPTLPTEVSGAVIRL